MKSRSDSRPLLVLALSKAWKAATALPNCVVHDLQKPF